MRYLSVIFILLALILTTVVVKADVYYPPIERVEIYYRQIKERNFEGAYSSRTPAYKAEHSYNDFYNMWENNCYIEIVDIWTISSPGSSAGNGAEAVIGLRIYSTDYDENGNKYSAYYSGKAYMVFWADRAGCDWQIDEIVLTRE